jgi:hypothetical protein
VASPAPAAAAEAALRGFAGPRWPSAARFIIFEALVKVKLVPVPIVLTAKILAIFAVAKGLAPWARVWCDGECPHAYPLKSLGGGSHCKNKYKNK